MDTTERPTLLLLLFRETWVPSLDGEDPLEKGTATRSNSLPWRTPWTEELGGLQSLGTQRVAKTPRNRQSIHVRTHDLKRQTETTVPGSPHLPGLSRSENSISQSASGREICIRPACQEFRPREGTAVAKPEYEVERVQFGVQGGGTGTAAQPKARSCTYPTLGTSSSFFAKTLRSAGSL